MVRGEKKGDKSKTHRGRLDYTTKRGDKDFHRGGHDVKRKRRPYTGRTKSSVSAEGAGQMGTGGARRGAQKAVGARDGPPRSSVRRRRASANPQEGSVRVRKSTRATGGKKKETINLGKKGKITFTKGGLHRSLKVPQSHKFTKSGLNRLKKIKTGENFTYSGKSIKMTPKIKKQITLGLTLMGFKK